MPTYPGTLIKVGSPDDDSIKLIKSKLNELGYGPLDVNNPRFGDTTKATVIEFQKKNQLLSDGVVGQLTWERLFTVSNIITPSSTILRIRALEVADTQLFVRELTGHNDGREVEEYLRSVGLWKGLPWCMAAFYWDFQVASVQLKVSNPVPKTGGVMDCLRKAKQYLIIDGPQPGDQFFMDFGGGKGHTGHVSEVKGNSIYTNEGNTSADPSYVGADREGNGRFERHRPISTIKAFARYE